MVKKHKKFDDIIQVRITPQQRIAIEEEKLERQYNSDSMVVRQIIDERLIVRARRNKAIREVQKLVMNWDMKRHEVTFK